MEPVTEEDGKEGWKEREVERGAREGKYEAGQTGTVKDGRDGGHSGRRGRSSQRREKAGRTVMVSGGPLKDSKTR